MAYKKTILFQSCFNSLSGYGEHARMLLLSLYENYSEKYNIKAISLPWGMTPDNALEEDNEKNKLIKSLLIEPHAQMERPNIFIQLATAMEFQPIGYYNIGITAGIETTACAPEWLHGINRMDLVIVPSKFAKDVFKSTNYAIADAQGNKIGELKCERPIEIVFEGIDTEVFGRTCSKYGNITAALDKIPENFGFLFVGHWLKGDFTHDRKNVSGLIYAFLMTFKDMKNPPFLLLKTSGADHSVVDRVEIDRKIKSIIKMAKENFPDVELPKIYLLHGSLTKSEMNALYNHSKIKVHISLTKGECWNLPLMEAAMSGKPIIASNWGGHLDYLHPNYVTLVKGTLEPVHWSAVWDKFIIAESSWFRADSIEASSVMFKHYKYYSDYKAKAEKLAEYVADNFSYKKMSMAFKQVLDKYLPEVRQEINFGKQKIAKLKLPKANEDIENGNENLKQEEITNEIFT